MPRDGTVTRNRLLAEAERLFARRGLYQVTVREILDAAGQRNASALTYHFGSREGMLNAILSRYGDPTDVERGARFAAIGEDPTTRQLVATLIVPYSAHLATPEGRNYLRIVAQMSDRFSTWREPVPGTGPHLIAILSKLEERPASVPVPLRRERVVELIMLMTLSLAERARVLDSTGRPELDHGTFITNLTDVLVGILEAPVNAPLTI